MWPPFYRRGKSREAWNPRHHPFPISPFTIFAFEEALLHCPGRGSLDPPRNLSNLQLFGILEAEDWDHRPRGNIGAARPSEWPPGGAARLLLSFWAAAG